MNQINNKSFYKVANKSQKERDNYSQALGHFMSDHTVNIAQAHPEDPESSKLRVSLGFPMKRGVKPTSRDLLRGVATTGLGGLIGSGIGSMASRRIKGISAVGGGLVGAVGAGSYSIGHLRGQSDTHKSIYRGYASRSIRRIRGAEAALHNRVKEYQASKLST